MVTQDRIRLTGLLRKTLANAGVFYMTPEPLGACGLRSADRCERRRQHRALHVRFREPSALQFGAGYVDDRANDGDQPLSGDVASEDAVRLASLEKRDDLRGHRKVPAAKFLCREPVDVDLKNVVKLAQLPPRCEEHSLQRFLRLTAIRLGLPD